MMNTAYAEWIGKRVQQTSCDKPEFQKNVGREGTVVDVITDEKNQVHVQTDDGVWCPARLMVLS